MSEILLKAGCTGRKSNVEGFSDNPVEQHLDETKCTAERCFFLWTVKDVFTQIGSSSKCFGATMFSASEDKENCTLWQIDLKPFAQNGDLHIYLTRLKSENASRVLVRLHWQLLGVNGSKSFPGSMHTIMDCGDWFSDLLITYNKLHDEKFLKVFLAGGNLRVLIELSVFRRQVEEIISAKVKSYLPYELSVLSDDMANLFRTESSSDLRIYTKNGVIRSHKSILSARSKILAAMLEKREFGKNRLNFYDLNVSTMHYLLMYIYCGNVGLYLEHTIPEDLYVEAAKHDFLPLLQHLDFIRANSITRLKSVDVKWNIPLFSSLIQLPKTVLYCPEAESESYFDDLWRFKLEVDKNSRFVSVSVLRKNSQDFIHFVKFGVQVETNGKITLQKCRYLGFSIHDTPEKAELILTNELCDLLSLQDTLVLKCSLEILLCLDSSPHLAVLEETDIFQPIIRFFAEHIKSSLSQLSEDFSQLFGQKTLSDIKLKTKIGAIPFHSCIVEARFFTPAKDLKEFLKNLQPSLVLPFFRFLYGGRIEASWARKMLLHAHRYELKNVMRKISDFLTYYRPSFQGTETL